MHDDSSADLRLTNLSFVHSVRHVTYYYSLQRLSNRVRRGIRRLFDIRSRVPLTRIDRSNRNGGKRPIFYHNFVIIFKAYFKMWINHATSLYLNTNYQYQCLFRFGCRCNPFCISNTQYW